MANFTNQTVFITGAGSGIGRATALAFAKDGAQVVVADINEKTGKHTVQLIQDVNGRALFVPCDVTKPAQIEQAIQQTVDTFGRLDIAVNNAGIGGRFARLLDQTADDFNQIMAVNVGSVFYGMQAQIRQMLTQLEDDQSSRGKIVNVSSIAGVRGMPMGAPYSASKHAVIGLTKTAALEYVKKNIRINAICPVYTHSAMVDELISAAPSMEERMRKLIPIGRLAQPEEIAQAILWLCDDANVLFTGQALQMDGGLTAG
ncbi:SDR family oxidoreductase [Spirosoma terrae]|uniref:Glucose 1-dehydrogenase n=1 Tax=Spirosoma terrae TaxID=1968276 RepID=A0A6L9L2E8_9BACT|nr:glucose 1-dehydrogenase [Spirosoma terrae]NDU93567.1 glucose 1-dehydrogenase [Spirosoma terrae]